MLLVRQENVIETEIAMGQLEELIEQAEDELSVIPVYLGACGGTLSDCYEGEELTLRRSATV